MDKRRIGVSDAMIYILLQAGQGQGRHMTYVSTSFGDRGRGEYAALEAVFRCQRKERGHKITT
jgi:hypothetical protein